MYTVELGRNKSAYKVRWRFELRGQAILYYNGLNVWDGYKKRLRENGKTIARVTTYARMAGSFPTSPYNDRDATWYVTLRDEAPVEPVALSDELTAMLYEQARREGFSSITGLLRDMLQGS